MSDAHAVAHGPFGRACLFEMDRATAPHAHREGHLIFHLRGPSAELLVDGKPTPLGPGDAVAISPWQPHCYRPLRRDPTVLALVLYIRPGWLMEASPRGSHTLRFGRQGIEVTDRIARLVADTADRLHRHGETSGGLEDRLSALGRAAFDQSWQWASESPAPPDAERGYRDFRIRRAVRLLQERLDQPIDLGTLSREAGVSRPHFFKLFRDQMGLPPAIYVNALRMERAIEQLAAGRHPVSDIGLDLGFATPASFSRFFIANGVVPPSVYRRSVSHHALS